MPPKKKKKSDLAEIIAAFEPPLHTQVTDARAVELAEEDLKSIRPRVETNIGALVHPRTGDRIDVNKATIGQAVDAAGRRIASPGMGPETSPVVKTTAETLARLVEPSVRSAADRGDPEALGALQDLVDVAHRPVSPIYPAVRGVREGASTGTRTTNTPLFPRPGVLLDASTVSPTPIAVTAAKTAASETPRPAVIERKARPVLRSLFGARRGAVEAIGESDEDPFEGLSDKDRSRLVDFIIRGSR